MMEVLKSKQQISEARILLEQMNASSIEPKWRRQLRRIGIRGGIPVGDVIKSWDVYKTIEFLSKNTGKNESILDIGAFASEVIVALHKLGYTNLTAADLNPELVNMPFSDSIDYRISDFLHTPFDDSSFKAITSISVIEHGFDGEALMKEVSRLLIPNGYFIASFDYWPEKIDTSGTRFFNMDWLIFSSQDIARLIDTAAYYGLEPVGDINTSADRRPISCAGYDYTFGWIVFRKLN